MFFCCFPKKESKGKGSKTADDSTAHDYVSVGNPTTSSTTATAVINSGSTSPDGKLQLDHQTTTYDAEAIDKDYDDLEHIARKREIRVTIRRGTQAGVAAGLSVMAGVIVAGPVGAVVGGAVGTAVAHKMSSNVVSLQDLLKATPAHKRHEIVKAFNETFKEEFIDTIQNNPELRLLMSGTTILGVMRYMVDRELLQNEQLEKVDKVLKRVKVF